VRQFASAAHTRRSKRVGKRAAAQPVPQRPDSAGTDFCNAFAAATLNQEAGLDMSESDDDDQLWITYDDKYVTGQVLCEKYELLRPIAEGGMGVVWVAHDRTLDVDVAVKISLRFVDDSLQRMTQRAVSEARLAAQNCGTAPSMTRQRIALRGSTPGWFTVVSRLASSVIAFGDRNSPGIGSLPFREMYGIH